MARMLKETLESEGYSTLLAGDGKLGIQMAMENNPDLILTDMKLPEATGMEVLRSSFENAPLRPVVMMTAYGSVETAVEAMKTGAYDFITKPFNIEHLLMVLRRALENRRLVTEHILLKEASHRPGEFPDIIGSSDAIEQVAESLKKVASAKTTLLLLGESGTGKELFAKACHGLSGRDEYPFVAINCAAIPRDLLESELFGYEKGAFTGAVNRKLGKFELANKGTVFLDEIADLDMSLQAKLLRVIQEGEIDRVGGDRPIKIDVRLIAATNKDLEQSIEDGSFREDLFYRINVFPLLIPALRERREDIPILANYFIRKYSRSMGKSITDITPQALSMLQNYDWKGNVRELENTIERAIILCGSGIIGVEHVSLSPVLSPVKEAGGNEQPLEVVSKEAVRKAETRRIQYALQDTGGNKTRAAEQLQVSYKTLLTKIKDYDIK